MGTNRTTVRKNLYNETVKIQKKYIEKETRTWSGFPCSWPGRTNIMKISILPKITCRLNAITIKISKTAFTDSENNILKYIGKHKRPRRIKAILIQGISPFLSSSYSTEPQ